MTCPFNSTCTLLGEMGIYRRTQLQLFICWSICESQDRTASNPPSRCQWVMLIMAAQLEGREDWLWSYIFYTPIFTKKHYFIWKLEQKQPLAISELLEKERLAGVVFCFFTLHVVLKIRKTTMLYTKKSITEHCPLLTALFITWKAVCHSYDGEWQLTVHGIPVYLIIQHLQLSHYSAFSFECGHSTLHFKW